jgi:hypothetical protein
MKASSLFLRTAVLAALVAMLLGTGMGLTDDFTLKTVHAHVNLLGWVSMFLFGLFYRLVPAADNRMALVHYGFSAVGLVLFGVTLTIFFLYGSREVLPLWALSALMTIVSMGLFAWNVFVATRSCDAASEAAAAPSTAG